MPSTSYDPMVIQKFADKLYRQANAIIIEWTLLGLTVGVLGGYALGDRGANTSYAVVWAVVLGLLCYAIGSSRAFLLMLQAQTALCQVRIEENTRKQMHPS